MIEVLQVKFLLMTRRLGLEKLWQSLIVHGFILLPVIIVKGLSLLLPNQFRVVSFALLAIVFLGGSQWGVSTITQDEQRMKMFFSGLGLKKIERFYQWRKPVSLMILTAMLLFPASFSPSAIAFYLFLLVVYLSVVCLELASTLVFRKHPAKKINAFFRVGYFGLHYLIIDDIEVIHEWLIQFDGTPMLIGLLSLGIILVSVNLYATLNIPRKMDNV